MTAATPLREDHAYAPEAEHKGWYPEDANLHAVRINDHETRLTDVETGGAGTGDMVKSVYDPTNKAADAFDAENMVEGATKKLLTAAERSKLAGVAANATANASDAQLRDRATHTGQQTSASIADLTEAVQDIVGAFIGSGSGVSVSYDDAANTFTITATGGGGATDPEVVRDTIGTALIGLGNINVAVNDAADTITITTTATQNATDAALRDRSTHTGTQLAATIADFNGAVDLRVPGWFHALTAKTTLATSDEILLLDSAATYGAKKILPTDLAAALAARMTAAQIKESPLASTAATLDLGTTPGNNQFIFAGTTATWTLMPLAGNSARRIVLSNRGSGALTVQRAGTDQIWKAAAVTSFTIPAGSTVGVYNDGTYWIVETLGISLLNIGGTPDGTKFLRDDGTWATVVGGGTAASFKTIADYAGFPVNGTANGNWTAAMNAMAQDSHGNAVGAGGDTGVVITPMGGKGVFDGWNATVLNYSNITVVNSAMSAWGVMLTLNAPLVNTSAVTAGKIYVKGIGMYAGTATSAIQIGTATDNGGRYRCIHDCEFWYFTGKAINITGSDTPYLDVRRCTFALGVGGIGIYSPGFTDSWVIEHNEFRAFKMGIWLDGLPSRAIIKHNNFMHVSDSNTGQRIDIFITASTSGFTARGQGCVIEDNWHGPEGRSLNGVVGDLFHVIADKTGNAPNLAADSTGTIHGLQIRGATTFDMGTTPLVYTTVSISTGLKYCSFGENCTRYGATGAPTLQFRTGGAVNASFGTNRVVPIMDEFTTVTTIDAAMVAAAVAAATAKAAPVDADRLPLIDSAAANGMKTLSIGDLKTAVRPAPRVFPVTSSATPTFNTDTTDLLDITAQAAAITSMSSGRTGTLVNGQTLLVRIRANAAYAITWGATYVSSGVASLPAATVANKTITVGLMYDSAAAKLVCLAVDSVGY